MNTAMPPTTSYPAKPTLLAALCLVLLLVSPATAQESTSNFEEWETDVLGLTSQEAAPTSEAQTNTSGFMHQAVEEWETDVLGMRLDCETMEAALVHASMIPNREHIARRNELAALWKGCTQLFGPGSSFPNSDHDSKIAHE